MAVGVDAAVADGVSVGVAVGEGAGEEVNVGAIVSVGDGDRGVTVEVGDGNEGANVDVGAEVGWDVAATVAAGRGVLVGRIVGDSPASVVAVATAIEVAGPDGAGRVASGVRATTG